MIEETKKKIAKLPEHSHPHLELWRNDLKSLAADHTDLQSRVAELEAENRTLIITLKSLDNILTVPAAEYVPAIRDAFEVIDATKKALGLNWAYSLKGDV